MNDMDSLTAVQIPYRGVCTNCNTMISAFSFVPSISHFMCPICFEDISIEEAKENGEFFPTR